MAANSPPAVPEGPASPGAAAATGASAQMPWMVRLFGAVEASRGEQTLSHWPTRAVAALLARLALEPDRVHPREELIELLWPGVELATGRNRLRQALSTLKRLLEPPELKAPPVLLADRLGVRVRPGALDSDVARFQRHQRGAQGQAALALYRGELMPGFYDEWVQDERRRLAELRERLERAPPAAVAPDNVTPVPTGLPSYWTRTFGAELAASRLLALACSRRLVTVHGPGGSGKTRLAVEVAQALHDGRHRSPGSAGGEPRFDRMAFVPLVDRLDTAQVLDAICAALHLGGEGDAQARITAALAGHRTLLVLDNVEQMIAAAGAAIVRLLAVVPALHVVVTSRQLLGVDGEQAFELEGLPLPISEARPAEAAVNPAVGLFVDRARAARSDFRLDESNAGEVIALVRLLGGMPLAIELAASRVRSLSPQELLQRLREDAGTPMLDLLARATQRADEGARHASMRHVVDWSWQQLSAPQAAMLQALSVFAAPARPDAIAAVADIDLRSARAVLDTLRDASLVRPVAGPDGTTRFALLQPVREFAAERMPAAAARSARQRLRQWLIGFALEALPRGPAAVAPEVAHVHAALVSAPADGAGRAALELAIALRTYWDSDELPLSDVLALELALQDGAAAGQPSLAVDAHELLAYARAAAGFAREGIAHAEAAVAGAGSDRARSLALTRWAWTMYIGGRLEEDRLVAALDEAGALAQRCGDLLAQAHVLRMQGVVASNFKLDYAGAEALAAQAQHLWERLGHRSMAYTALLNRAMMWAWQGRNEEAHVALTECEHASQLEGDWVGMLNASRQNGRVLARMRRWPEAIAAFRRSARVGWQRNFARGLANILLNLPEALAMAGQPEAAARLHGFATANWARLYGAINRIETRELRRARLLLRLHLGAARAEGLRVEGAGLDMAGAVALALDEKAA